MTTKIAINGFGRIGRQLLKILHEQYNDVVDVRAINNSKSLEVNAHMLKYDSTHGPFSADIEVRDGIYIDGKRLHSLSERHPAKLPWRELEIDIVAECTGVFRTHEQASLHLQSGAKKVVISAPSKGAVDLTVCHARVIALAELVTELGMGHRVDKARQQRTVVGNDVAVVQRHRLGDA